MLRRSPRCLYHQHLYRKALAIIDRNIGDCTSIHALLKLFLRVVRPLGIARIRFYKFHSSTEQLVSIACVGHAPSDELLIQIGAIRKSYSACPLEKADSFWCVKNREPVIFEFAEADDQSELRVVNRIRNIPIVRVYDNQCQAIGSFERNSWKVDLPLLSSGEVLGKLSCDLSCPKISTAAARRVQTSYRLLQRMIPAIEAHQHRTITVSPVVGREIRDAISNIGTLKGLFDFCVGPLPKFFAAVNSSVLTSATDDVGSVKLILRRTSFGPSRDLEDGGISTDNRIGYYQLSPAPDRSLTAWVAALQRPLRLQLLGDACLVERQLKAIDSDLVWRNRIPDNAPHSSFLATPIGVSGRLLGVLRFTGKCAASSGYFTDSDETTLAGVCSDFIGPKLADLQRQEAHRLFCDPKWQQPTVKALTQAVHKMLTSDQYSRDGSVNLGLAMKNIPKNDQSVQSCFVSLIEGSKVSKRISFQKGLKSRDANLLSELYEPTVRTVVDENRSVFMHLPQQSLRSQRSSSRPQSACFVACPINLGQRGKAAFVLHSDHHDLTPEVHVPLLSCMTELASGLLTCRLPKLDW